MSHASPAMTRHYTHLGVESLRKAVEALSSGPAMPALLLPAESTAKDRLALAAEIVASAPTAEIAEIAERLRAELLAVLMR